MEVVLNFLEPTFNFNKDSKLGHLIDGYIPFRWSSDNLNRKPRLVSELSQLANPGTKNDIIIHCVGPLDNLALRIAIENEDIKMVQRLVDTNIAMRDAGLHPHNFQVYAGSERDRTARRRWSKINVELKKEESAASNTLKLLLLGTDEAGKSTLLKSMRLNPVDKFKPYEIDQHKEIILSNTIKSLETIMAAMSKFSIPFLSESSQADGNIVTDVS